MSELFRVILSPGVHYQVAQFVDLIVRMRPIEYALFVRLLAATGVADFSFDVDMALDFTVETGNDRGLEND